MRQRLFNAALKKGQLQTAHMILDSLGRANGETQEAVKCKYATEFKYSD